MKYPRGLQQAGKQFYQQVCGEWELDPPEHTLLVEACKTLDLLADLRANVAENGVMSETGRRVNPAVVEVRQLTAVLARLLGSLGLPRGLVK